MRLLLKTLCMSHILNKIDREQINTYIYLTLR